MTKQVTKIFKNYLVQNEKAQIGKNKESLGKELEIKEKGKVAANTKETEKKIIFEKNFKSNKSSVFIYLYNYIFEKNKLKKN